MIYVVQIFIINRKKNTSINVENIEPLFVETFSITLTCI